MKNFAIYSLLHTKIEFIPKNFRWPLFSLLHKRPVIYHKAFPTYLVLTILPGTFIFLPFYIQNLLLLSSLVPPLETVSPGAARPPNAPPIDATAHVNSYIYAKSRCLLVFLASVFKKVFTVTSVRYTCMPSIHAESLMSFLWAKLSDSSSTFPPPRWRLSHFHSFRPFL